MKLNFDRFSINYNNGNELVIKKKTLSQLLTIAWQVLVFIILIVFSFSKDDIGQTEKGIIFLVAASIIVGAYKPLKTIISKEQFSFNLTSQTIYQNKNLKTTFSKVDYIEIVHLSGGDGGSDSYLINLRLKDKTSIQIDDSPNSNETNKVAGEIASFINKEVRKK